MQAALVGKVTNVEAPQALGLSGRQFRRLKVTYRRAGVAGLLHGDRGRSSPRRLSGEDRERIVERINTRSVGLDDCHLTEKLRELEGLRVCRATVRHSLATGAFGLSPPLAELGPRKAASGRPKSWAPATRGMSERGVGDPAGRGPQDVPRIDRAPVSETPSLAIGGSAHSRSITSRTGNTPYSLVGGRALGPHALRRFVGPVGSAASQEMPSQGRCRVTMTLHSRPALRRE